MDTNNTAVEDKNQTAASGQTTTPPVVTSAEDYEAQIAKLEAEKAKAIEEGSNWKIAALKAKGKLPTEQLEEGDETPDEKMRRIAREELANTKIIQIDTEKDALVKKMARELSELKLANLNKTTTPPAAMGAHSESAQVNTTDITPEQLAAFKARGWTDKDIENYRKNLKRYGGR